MTNKKSSDGGTSASKQSIPFVGNLSARNKNCEDQRAASVTPIPN